MKHHLDKIAMDVAIIQETQISSNHGAKFVKYCRKWTRSFHSARDNAGGLSLIWNPNTIEGSIRMVENNWMLCNITSRVSNVEFPLFNIYEPTKMKDKAMLWNTILETIKDVDRDKMILGRDFNAILDLSEKSGKLTKFNRIIFDFRAFIKSIEVVDCIPKKRKYT